MTATIRDYPFNNWSDYFEALTEYLSTRFYEETYPFYKKYHASGGADKAIVVGLLAKGDKSVRYAEEGLNGFIKAILAGSRYAGDMEDEIVAILKLFLRQSVCVMPYADQLFKPTYSASTDFLMLEGDMGDFEDEVANYPVRGMMIDILAKYKIDVSVFGMWNDIEATYWENIPVGKYTFEQARLMYLKYCSTYLQRHVPETIKLTSFPDTPPSIVRLDI